MGADDQRQFTDAVAARGRSWLREDWAPAIHALNRLAMFDMLPALAAISQLEREAVERLSPGIVGLNAAKRMMFANIVVKMREVPDWSGSVLDEQTNDAREFLGCTRFDEDGVQHIVADSLARASASVPTNPAYASEICCGVIRYAWLKVLVPQRQAPGGSLISNLAAAAHYMLARYHVCAAKATSTQMKIVVEGYDEKKRAAIAHGDPDLKAMAITANRPFPPDFAIRKWAYKGAGDGERDRLRCNADKPLPWIAPQVNQSEWGE